MSRYRPFGLLLIVLSLFACAEDRSEWEGIWRSDVEYIPDYISVFEFDLHRNVSSRAWEGHWESTDLFVSGEIEEVKISDQFIEIVMGEGLVFKGKRSPDKRSIDGIMSGFSLEGDDTLSFEKADQWVSQMPARLDENNRRLREWNYKSPPQESDGWEVAAFEESSESGQLADLFQRVIEGEFQGLDAVLIAHQGQLVVEEYFHLGAREKPHTLQSCTKSVVSLLIGTALDAGLIEDLNQPLENYFPQHKDSMSSAFKRIDLKHALTMSAGLHWNEWELSLSDSQHDLRALNESPDMYRFMLNRNLEIGASPGDKFNYNTGLSVLLGGVLLDVAEVSADKYAAAHLFKPLGIQQHHWYALNGIIHTGGGLWLRPRDFLKLGQLVLNNGQWNGQQIVSRSWIEESTRVHRPVRQRGETGGYGYQWWNGHLRSDGTEFPVIWAEGLGGQFLFIVPDMDLVTLFMHHNPPDLALEHTMAWKEMEEYIMPAFYQN